MFPMAVQYDPTTPTGPLRARLDYTWQFKLPFGFSLVLLS